MFLKIWFFSNKTKSYEFEDVSDDNVFDVGSFAVTSSLLAPLFSIQLPFSKPVSAINNKARLAASF